LSGLAIDADGSGRDMLSSIQRFWRVLGTGLGFLPVGIGGVLVFPVLNLMVREPKRRRTIARDLVQLTFRCIVRSMCALGVFQYETKGLERLERRRIGGGVEQRAPRRLEAGEPGGVCNFADYDHRAADYAQ